MPVSSTTEGFRLLQTHNLSTRCSSDQEFDLDFSTDSIKGDIPINGLITSKSLCTPGCGKTGTGNSFCCSCK